MSAGCSRADRAFRVPRCLEKEFIGELLEICRKHEVALVIPTIDTELEVLAANRSLFSEIGTQLAISKPDVVSMARNKLLTHLFLKEIAIPTPRTTKFDGASDRFADWRFPVILKPVAGSSSVGLSIHRNPEELSRADIRRDDYIAQELWSGLEYTVNLFFDSKSLRCSIPHLRCEVRAGEVSKGVTQRIDSLIAIAERLGDALKGRAFGALCFQAIRTEENRVGVFEINARFGGGYPLADRAGATFARWLLELVLTGACSAHNNWSENVTMLRYDAAVFPELGPGTKALAK